jgi:ubiquinone/menaquinone biosynthesis C-methylase UbiE
MNLALVEQTSKVAIEGGCRVFQAHRFAASEKEHVERLARWAELPDGASVIDLGCGTGEVARIMREQRPDLRFTLVNLSPLQLSYAPHDMTRHCCDFRDVPEPAAAFDAALHCFSIGHEDIAEGFAEAARLLRAGGVLFVYDMVRVSGDNSSMACVEYEVHNRADMCAAALRSGLRLDFYMEPQDDGAFANAQIGEAYPVIFAGTIPAVWRFIKC